MLWTNRRNRPGRCFAPAARRNLHPGSGAFFQITIEAVADPSPPVVPGDESPSVLRRRIDRLIEELRDVSEREAMDQVHRRLVIHLCNRCYRGWIENPAS